MPRRLVRAPGEAPAARVKGTGTTSSHKELTCAAIAVQNAILALIFFSTPLDVACDISPSTDQITHLNSAFELRDP